MSQPWISGRFRGVYAGERAPDSAEVQRLPVELEYGELHDVQGSEPPAESPGPRELRFDRLRRVKLAPGSEGLPHGERTLFDVRIRDWQLLYPAESSKRVYGTLVGTLSARLAPAPVETPPLPELPVRPLAPSEPAAPAAASAPETEQASAAPAKAKLTVPDMGVDQRDVTTPDQDLARLLGLIVSVLLIAVGLSLAVACGPASAVLWLSPICAAIALRFLLAQALVRAPVASWLLGGLCWATQIYVVVAPLEIAWQASCRAPIRDQLLLLGAPVLVAALVRKPLFAWGAAAIWTAILVGWCSQLDGTCAQSGSSALVPYTQSAPLGGPAGPGADPLEAEPREPRLPASDPAAAPEPADTAADAPARTQTADTARRERADAPVDASAPARRRAPAPAAAPAPEPEPELAERPSRAPRGALEGPGGWIAEGDLAPEPGALRMSLEQANRNPEAFFAAREPRRVYVQTDDVFETGSADLVRGGDLELARLANLLKLHPERRVVIEVHNDATAGETQRWLSQRRADAVRAWLIHRGHLSGDQLAFELKGDASPLVPADGTYAERRPNRRLEVRLADAGQ